MTAKATKLIIGLTLLVTIGLGAGAYFAYFVSGYWQVLGLAGLNVGLAIGLIVVLNVDKSVPTSLRVVAWLFILLGIGSVSQVIVCNLLNRPVNYNFDFLGIFIGPGILKLRRGWRICGLFLTWWHLIVPLVGLIILIFSTAGPTMTVRIDGLPVQVPKVYVAIFIVVVFLVASWVYSVLTRRDIKEQFGLTTG